MSKSDKLMELSKRFWNQRTNLYKRWLEEESLPEKMSLGRRMKLAELRSTRCYTYSLWIGIREEGKSFAYINAKGVQKL